MKSWLIRAVLFVFGLVLVVSTGLITLLRREAAPPRWIVYYSGSSQTSYDIYRMYPDGSRVQQLTDLPEDEENPVWSPDGRWIAFVRSVRTRRDTDLYLMSFDGRQIQPLHTGHTIDFDPSWSPDGKWLIFTSLSDPFDQLIDDFYRVNLDTRKVERIPTDDTCNAVDTSRWSPDGASLVFAASCAGGMDIYRMDLASRQIRRLTDHPEKELSPSWSPDGRWITFSMHEDNGYNVYRMAADGSQRQRLTNQPGDEVRANWSPDGQWIVFIASSTNSEIYRMRPDGSDLRRLTHTPDKFEFSASWSPLIDVPFHPILSILVGITCLLGGIGRLPRSKGE